MASSSSSMLNPEVFLFLTFVSHTFTLITLKFNDDNFLSNKSLRKFTVFSFRLFWIICQSLQSSRQLKILMPTMPILMNNQLIVAWLLATMSTPILTKMMVLKLLLIFGQDWDKIMYILCFSN